jgi:hypothetical protein
MKCTGVPIGVPVTVPPLSPQFCGLLANNGTPVQQTRPKTHVPARAHEHALSFAVPVSRLLIKRGKLG